MVPEPYALANSKRKYTKKTHNGYDRGEVASKLEMSIRRNLVIQSNYWSVELAISGYYDDIWGVIWNVVMNHIVLDLKLLNYVLKEFRYLQGIKDESPSEWVNRQEIRNHLSELMTVLSQLPKKKVAILKPSKITDGRNTAETVMLNFKKSLNSHRYVPYWVDRLMELEVKMPGVLRQACHTACHGHTNLWNILEGRGDLKALRGYLIWLITSDRPTGDLPKTQTPEVISMNMKINKIYRDLIFYDGNRCIKKS